MGSLATDKGRVVSAGADFTLKVWDAATGTERTRLSLSGRATAVAFHPRERLLGLRWLRRR